MNAEQLNGILWRFVEGHRAQGTVKKFAAVRSAIEAIASEPGSAAHQKQFRDNLHSLLGALHVDALNVFSVREESLIDDLKLRGLVGNELARMIGDAVAGQDITPRVAADAIVKLHDGMQNRLSKLQQTQSGLTELGVEKGEPDAGSVELGLFVPRHDGDLSLAEILAEGNELNRLVTAAYEVVEGESKSPPVRYLTSSDYGFLVEMGPQVVAFLVLAVERSLALYKGWLETQVLHRQLKERGASDDLIAPLVDASKRKLDADLHDEIRQAVQERSRSTDEGRKNELANQVVAEVRIFLNKAERGNYLDIRVGMEEAPPEKEDDGQEAKDARTRVNLLREVELIARRLHALERGVEPAKLPPPRER